MVITHRLRAPARLVVAAAVFAGLLASGAAAVLFAAPAQAAFSRQAAVSTLLPEKALAVDVTIAPAVDDGLGVPRVGRAAPTPGSGGWYWPIGTEDFGSYAGFLDPRGAYVHVAQDMHAPKGRPVYAIGAGTVWIARADAGGYGVGGAPGGCVIIVHRTAAGEQFHALYGHVSGLKVKAGAHVTAGAVIATVNGCDHVHFSIHPGDVYRDRNPYAGHVPKTWKDHGGFVDPVKYLKVNPRASSYVAPALPLVTITTDAAPSRYGAVAGTAYWDEQGEAGPATYAFDLVAGTRRRLAPGEEAPRYDEARYAVDALAEPALGLSVRDRQPVLSAEARPVAPAWGAPTSVAVSLVNAAGKPFKDARIAFEWLDGAEWTRITAGLTDGKGRVTFAYTPPRRTVLRVQFLLPAEQPPRAVYVAAEGGVLTVAPRVRLSVPGIAARVVRGAATTVTGSLAPRHKPGKGSVRLELQRLSLEGVWAAALTADVVLSDAAGGSLYSRVVRLDDAGAWRVRAVHPGDAAHATTASKWRPFVVE